jgi:hypothetical protein
MRFEYVVIPFMGVVKVNLFGSEGPGKVASDLQKVLNDMSMQGWDYVRVESIDILQTAGCFASLLGQKSTMYTFNQIVFRRPVTTQ